MNKVMQMLDDKTFLDNLYGFAYRRTNNSYEAEDLSSDIVVAILAAARGRTDVANAHAFVWAIARRVYADFCQKRQTARERTAPAFTENIAAGTDMIDAYIEDEDDRYQLRRILREIMFLSKIYRDVCVMYYLDGMKVADIAGRLGVSQNVVKQRLYSARSTIKTGLEKTKPPNLKGVEDMTQNLTLKPVEMSFIGNGNPVGNNPSIVATRSFSKSLVYLCKNAERSVKELSELLGVPMPFVEEEVDIQLAGENGYYGLLRKTDSGKIVANTIIVDYEDHMKMDAMYRRHAGTLAAMLDKYIKENEAKILAMPFLNKQTDTKLVAWQLAVRTSWFFADTLRNVLGKRWADIPQIERPYSVIIVAYKDGQWHNFKMYGTSGAIANDIGEYKRVFVSNMSGPRLQSHFFAGHNISTDAKLLLTVRAIGGLPLSQLSHNDKETAARAIEEGYLKKEGDTLVPNILVSEDEWMYGDMLQGFFPEVEGLVSQVADEAYAFVKKYVPKHLMGDAGLFVDLSAGGLADGLVEGLIELGALVPPPGGRPSAAGVMMVVSK
ncbi:MAG: sigma-70 family RNA polymerase sigma factor [Defluviitaleaceae bacterium]|nr:sigma-70 family RNA polymerase sigma factor [Defluviitaleaceae bacterium]